MERTLSGATTPDRRGPKSNDKEGALRIPQNSSITGSSLSDCLVSYSGHSLVWCLTPSEEMQSVYSRAPADRARFEQVLPHLLCNITWPIRSSASSSSSWSSWSTGIPSSFFLSLSLSLSLYLSIYLSIYLSSVEVSLCLFIDPYKFSLSLSLSLSSCTPFNHHTL